MFLALLLLASFLVSPAIIYIYIIVVGISASAGGYLLRVTVVFCMHSLVLAALERKKRAGNLLVLFKYSNLAGNSYLGFSFIIPFPLHTY